MKNLTVKSYYFCKTPHPRCLQGVDYSFRIISWLVNGLFLKISGSVKVKLLTAAVIQIYTHSSFLKSFLLSPITKGIIFYSVWKMILYCLYISINTIIFQQTLILSSITSLENRIRFKTESFNKTYEKV